MIHNFITSQALLTELISLLKSIQDSTLPKAFVGFDGFVDTIQKAVKQRTHTKVTYFQTISEMAEHLARMNGKSGQVELVTEKIKMGGNAPILSNALGKLGVPTTCVAAAGWPEINPLFKSANPLVEVISAAQPGHSSAIELDNGKVIFSDLGVFKKYNWDRIKKTIDIADLRKSAEACQLFALVDWANLSEATDIWNGFLMDVIKPAGKKEQHFLFDLCDPSKKPPQQIVEILDLITAYSDFGRVTLGLNENEANKIWLALNGYDPVGDHGKVEIPPLNSVGYFIYRAMDIDTLLIHPLDRTIVFRNQKDFKKPSLIELYGHVVKAPRVQTGGGDNLNAGYCLGLLAGMEVHHSMLLGMAASGFYVKNGTSPTVSDLVEYLAYWKTKLPVHELFA
jgi:hypothetical protein